MPKIQIDFSQPSTMRGAILCGTGLMAMIAYLVGKDPVPLLAIGASLTGSVGLLFSDNHTPPLQTTINFV